jgi:ribosome-binding protein aMBF1 (putative translation factor)
VVVLEEKEMHLVKKVSKELGLTYKELGEEIGYSESMLRQSVSKNTMSSQLKKVLELYIKTIRLEQELNKTEAVKDVLRAFLEK